MKFLDSIGDHAVLDYPHKFAFVISFCAAGSSHMLRADKSVDFAKLRRNFQTRPTKDGCVNIVGFYSCIIFLAWHRHCVCHT